MDHLLQIKPKININSHHMDYSRIGNEKLTDLIVICRPCHETIHKFVDKMGERGFSRGRVLSRLKPYCIRRMVLIHELHRKDSPIIRHQGARNE